MYSAGRMTDYSQEYPDVDSIVHATGFRSDIRLRSRKIGEQADFVLIKESPGDVKIYEELPTAEMEALDNEGRATYIIYRLMHRRYVRRGVTSVILLFSLYLVGIALALYYVFGISFSSLHDYIGAFGGLGVFLFLLLIYYFGVRGEHRVDRAVFRLRPNLPDVFLKIANVQDADFLRQAFIERAERLEQLR